MNSIETHEHPRYDTSFRTVRRTNVRVQNTSAATDAPLLSRPTPSLESVPKQFTDRIALAPISGRQQSILANYDASHPTMSKPIGAHITSALFRTGKAPLVGMLRFLRLTSKASHSESGPAFEKLVGAHRAATKFGLHLPIDSSNDLVDYAHTLCDAFDEIVNDSPATVTEKTRDFLSQGTRKLTNNVIKPFLIGDAIHAAMLNEIQVRPTIKHADTVLAHYEPTLRAEFEAHGTALSDKHLRFVSDLLILETHRIRQKSPVGSFRHNAVAASLRDVVNNEIEARVSTNRRIAPNSAVKTYLN